MEKDVLENKEVSDALHCLFHCARKDKGYGSQYEQFRLVYDYIDQLEMTNNKLMMKILNLESHPSFPSVCEMYKNRIDKAIEYIRLNDIWLDVEEIRKGLIEILKGVVDE